MLNDLAIAYVCVGAVVLLFYVPDLAAAFKDSGDVNAELAPLTAAMLKVFRVLVFSILVLALWPYKLLKL